MEMDPATRLRELKKEKLRRLRDEKYRYYVPTAKSEEFINLVGGNQKFVSLYSAANGVGKTRCGVNLLAHLIWPVNNQYFQAPLFKDWPYPRNILIVSNHVTVESTIVAEIKDQWPKNRYTTDKKGRSFESHIETDNGWTLDILTYDQSLDAFESSTRGLIWFDEPPPAAIFKACVARTRKGGVIFITATPLMGSAWMYDSIISPTDEDMKEQTGFVTADVESACKIHGERGFLDHDTILRIVSQYSDEDKQARIFGKFQHLSGLVFKEFSRKVHVIEPFDINRRDFVVVQRLDTHPRTNDACLWVAIDAKGTKFVVDELFLDVSDEELGVRIKAIDDKYRVVSRKIDPSAFIVDHHTGKSLAGSLLKYGLSYEPASKDRTYAVRRIRRALHYVVQNQRIIKPPELYVFAHLARTIWEFEHWQWNEWRGQADNKAQMEKPVDKDDHMMESLGRALVDEPVWFAEPAQFNPTYSQAERSLDPYD